MVGAVGLCPTNQGPKGEDLTLDAAVSRALQLNPALAAGSYAVSAAEARINQAGLFPNPEIDIEAENFGGEDDLSGYNGAETTAIISQPIPLGRRRGHGRAVAETDHILANRDLEASRLNVVAESTSRFYRLIAAQERQELAKKMVELAERFEGTVRSRVEAGKVSPVEATRAGIEVGQARVRLARASRELATARTILAATWGSTKPDFGRAVGELPNPEVVPGLGQLRAYLIGTPEIARLEDQVEQKRRAADLEKSFRFPDLRVSVGPRRFQETGETAWVAGLSVPIPVFDRNQGSRKAAEFEVDQAKREAEALRVAREAQLVAVLERLHATAAETTIMNDEVVPAANAAFIATETGYSEGKFGFLNVLDAQRTLFESHSLLLDIHEDYAATRTELERLIGRELNRGDSLSPAQSATQKGDQQ